MSDPQPLPAQPLEYFNPNDIPPGRPASVLVVAILAIVFGCYSALSLLSAAFMLFGGIFGSFRAVGARSFFMIGYALDSLASGILGVTLLVGGILALSLKPLGRRLLIFYAIAHCILGSAGAICLYVIFIPRMISTTTSIVNGKTVTTTVNQPNALSPMWVLAIPNLTLILLWSVVILIVMTRPRVKSAFLRT